MEGMEDERILGRGLTGVLRCLVLAIPHTGKLARKHKTIIHMVLVTFIAISLWEEGAKKADWLFVGLAILCEIC